MLKTGDVAPEVEGPDQRGEKVSLRAALEKGPVVLYFYPKDFTPGCTREACLFRDAYEELREVAGEVIGVSVDDGASHRRFAERHGLPFPLLADADKRIAKAYGVLQVFGLFTKRVTFVVDRGGVIRGVFHHELDMGRHVDDVRALLRELGGA